MSYSDTAVLTVQRLYPYYGHSLDALTPRDVLEWKQVFVKARIQPEVAESITSELAAAHETIAEISQVFPLFCQVAREALRVPKEQAEEKRNACAYCRGKGIASVTSRRDPFDTESVACICAAGQSWAERCATGPNPFKPRSRWNDLKIAQEVLQFHNMHDERAKAWAKERGLDEDDETQFWAEWKKVKEQMAREMFKTTADWDTSEKEKKKRAESDEARRLTMVLKVRPVHRSQIPDGWEVAVFDRDLGTYAILPDQHGNYQPDTRARVVKKRREEVFTVGSIAKKTHLPARVDDRELALAAYQNGDERGWE
jgi:hypothetical protein